MASRTEISPEFARLQFRQMRDVIEIATPSDVSFKVNVKSNAGPGRLARTGDINRYRTSDRARGSRYRY